MVLVIVICFCCTHWEVSVVSAWKNSIECFCLGGSVSGHCQTLPKKAFSVFLSLEVRAHGIFDCCTPSLYGEVQILPKRDNDLFFWSRNRLGTGIHNAPEIQLDCRSFSLNGLLIIYLSTGSCHTKNNPCPLANFLLVGWPTSIDVCNWWHLTMLIAIAIVNNGSHTCSY